MNGKYILTNDLGTSANKAVLFDSKLNVIAQATENYSLYYPKPGWVEQDAEDFWKAIINCTQNIIKEHQINPDNIIGLTFTCQMNCTIAIDEGGKPLMRCISWLDTRAAENFSKYNKGFIKVSGYALPLILMFLKITGGGPGHNGKDPISHQIWLKDTQPDLYDSVFKFLSVKDFVIYRCCKKAIVSKDQAHVSWLMDIKNSIWSHKILDKFGLDIEKLPEIKDFTDYVGELSDEAAKQLGLNPGTPIFAGSGDLTSTAIGSGAVDEEHKIVCLGTSAWVGAHTYSNKKSIPNYTGPMSSLHDRNLCISKQETGAACLDWIMDKLYQDKIQEFSNNPKEIYKYLDAVVEKSEPGAKKLLFAPWLYGERSPINDPDVRGGFYNLSLNQEREDILRAVYEGVAFNLRWSLWAVEKLIGKSQSVNFIGGGAKSDIWCQILADILQKTTHQMEEAELGASKGCAIIALEGLGIIKDIAEALSLIKIRKTFEPNPKNKNLYDKLFDEYIQIYKRNKKMFKNLNF